MHAQFPFEIESESEKSLEITEETEVTASTSAKTGVKTRKTNMWSTVAKFNTFAEADEFHCKGGFRKHGFKDGKDGRKSNYHCNKIKQTTKKQCAAQRRIFESASTTDFEIQAADADH